VNHGPGKPALISFDYPGSARRIPPFGHRVPKTSVLCHQHGVADGLSCASPSAWASTSVPGLLAAGQAAVRWRGEIRTSRGRRPGRTQKPRNSISTSSCAAASDVPQVTGTCRGRRRKACPLRGSRRAEHVDLRRVALPGRQANEEPVELARPEAGSCSEAGGDTRPPRVLGPGARVEGVDVAFARPVPRSIPSGCPPQSLGRRLG